MYSVVLWQIIFGENSYIRAHILAVQLHREEVLASIVFGLSGGSYAWSRYAFVIKNRHAYGKLGKRKRESRKATSSMTRRVRKFPTLTGLG